MKTISLKSLFLPLLLTGLLSACTTEKSEDITVYMIGDSTMANKKDPDHNPERGWGMVFPGLFREELTFKNYAVNGRSSKSFLDEGRWDTILNNLKPGDYVIIQFGHNDQKVMDPRRYTNPYTSYRRNLVKYITDTRKRNAHPILCSSIVRRHFNEQGTLEDSHGAYPFVARLVAQEYDVPFLDLQLRTEDWVQSLGDEASREYFMNLAPGEYEVFPDGRNDNTHLVEKGAYAVSVFAARELEEQGVPLANYLKPGLLDE